MYDVFERLLNNGGMSVAEVCKATGISHSTMTDWKKGRTTPKLDKLKKLADYFGVPLSYFTSNNDGAPIEFDSTITKEKSPFDYFPEGYSGNVDGSGNVSITYPDGKRINTSITELDRIVRESEAFIRFKLEMLKSEQQKV